jgi:uncharacterized protein YbjT (DUF2867 family)
VLLLGATGGVGRLTTEALRANGHHVVAFGRSAADRFESAEGLAPFVGDVTNAREVGAAMAGVDAAALTFGAPMEADTVLHVPDLCEVGTWNVLSAMSKHGVRRLVCMTMIGVGDSEGHGRFVFRNLVRPVLLGRIVQDREAQEALVRKSGTDWTIVRPTELNDDEATGDFKALENLEGVTASTIPRADVAAFLAAMVDDPTRVGRTYLLTR